MIDAPTETSASAAALSTVIVHPERLTCLCPGTVRDLNPLWQCATPGEHNLADVDLTHGWHHHRSICCFLLLLLLLLRLLLKLPLRLVLRLQRQ